MGYYYGGFLVALLFFQSSGLPVWGVIAATAAVSVVLGVTIERLAYKPLRGGSRMSALITTIGVSLMLQNGFLLIFGSSPKPFPNHFTGEGFTLGGVTVSRLTAITLVVTVVLMVLLTLFVNRTRVGKAMRAVSEDQGAAQLMGINIDTSISITFAIGSALAAVAAVLYSSTYPLINPYMGSMLGLRAFIAAVIGGIGVIPGAMIGGFIIGIAEALIKRYISSAMARRPSYSPCSSSCCWSSLRVCWDAMSGKRSEEVQGMDKAKWTSLCRRRNFLALVLGFGLLYGLMSSGFISMQYQGIIITIGIYVLLAASLNLTTGVLGELVLGHAGFMSIGAYTAALFTLHMDLPALVEFPLALLLGGALAAVFGVLIGIPALRLRGDYLAIRHPGIR